MNYLSEKEDQHVAVKNPIPFFEVQMNTQALPELINQAQQLLTQIRQHPQYKALDYHPDVNVADAQQALTELVFELAVHSKVD